AHARRPHHRPTPRLRPARHPDTAHRRRVARTTTPPNQPIPRSSPGFTYLSCRNFGLEVTRVVGRRRSGSVESAFVFDAGGAVLGAGVLSGRHGQSVIRLAGGLLG